MDSMNDGVHRLTRMCQTMNLGKARESVEEDIPKILSPELNDVFHVFANMLDIKSFMKLALTSKDMYKRCMENKSIKIDLDVEFIEAFKENDVAMVRYSHYGSERVGLKSFYENVYNLIPKLPCKVFVDKVDIRHHFKAIDLTEFRSYIDRIGVRRINALLIHDLPGELETLLAIVKDFDVKKLSVYGPIDNDVLRSFFQLKLKLFRYTEIAPLDIMLEMDISIRKMIFVGVMRISTEELMHISSKIQSGSLFSLTFRGNAIDWSVFDVLPFDHDGPLPDTRPLLLKREPYSKEYYGYNPLDTNCEYWLLDPYGGIVVCRLEYSWLKLSPCEPWEYPWILRREEDILKDLAEKRPNVSCSESQFLTFSSSFTTIERSHEGPLPEIRPLSCKVSEYEFWLLDEEDKLMNCTWENGCALWKTFERKFGRVEHPALAKYTFWKFVRQEERSDGYFKCKEEEFDSWFDGYDELDLQYSGPLPSTRPLVFDGRANYKCVRVVLLEDRLVECTWTLNEGVKIKPCTWSNRPFILFNVKHVVEMLRDKGRERMHSPIHLRDMIYEKTATEFWFMVDRAIGKVDWKEGYDRLKGGNDFRKSPSNFMKQVFRRLAENEPRNSKEYFTLDLERFQSCLDQFTVLPFDYSGPLATGSPLAFVKGGVGHDAWCRWTNDSCGCRKRSLLVWFLWNGVRVTYCSWGRWSQEDVLFGSCDYFNILPPALKSKEYLKNLILGKYDDSSKYEWLGCFEDFLAYLNEYVKLPFDYTARLPSGRPLVFDCGPSDDHPSHYILREDGTIIQCVKTASHITMTLSSNNENVPPALKTKDYLKNLIQSKYDSSSSCDWFGRFDDFLACLNEYVKLPFDYDARLPNERPLVFDSRSDDKDPIYFILREDETIIQCLKGSSYISLSLSSNYEFVPPVLKSLL